MGQTAANIVAAPQKLGAQLGEKLGTAKLPEMIGGAITAGRGGEADKSLETKLNAAAAPGFGDKVRGWFGGKRQAGGPVGGGHPYLVGEGGPEVFVPDQSGHIVPNRGGMPATMQWALYGGAMAAEFAGGRGLSAAAAGALHGQGGAGGSLLGTMLGALPGSGILQKMKDDSETGNSLRTWLRKMLGLEDPGEPAPWRISDRRRQLGGPVSAGQRYLVGEAGPETFMPAGGAGGGGEGRRLVVEQNQQIKELNANSEDQNEQMRQLTEEMRTLNQSIAGPGGGAGGSGAGGGPIQIPGGGGGGGGGGGIFNRLFGGGGGGGFAGGGGSAGGGGASGGWGGGGVGAGLPSTGGGDIAAKGDVDAAIKATAGKAGMDPAHWKAIADIELSLNPSIKNKFGYQGLYQMGGPEWAKYGGGKNWADPMANAQGAAALATHNAAIFRRAKGRDPTPAETYLMHQQGAGFYTGANIPTSHLMGNLPPSLKRLGRAPTHAEFEQGWTDEVNRRAAKYAVDGGGGSSGGGGATGSWGGGGGAVRQMQSKVAAIRKLAI